MHDPDDLLILGDGPGARETARAGARLGLCVRQVVPPEAAVRPDAAGWPWPFAADATGPVAGDIAPPVRLEGRPFLSGGGGVVVRDAEGPPERRPRRLVLAPRLRPARPSWWAGPVVAPTDPAVWTGPLPARVVVVGGGHTGVEVAAAWADARREVLLVESGDRLLPDWDPELGGHAAAALAARGVTILVGWRAVAVEAVVGPSRVRLRRGHGAADRDETTDLVVPALGWRPALAGLGLERTRALADRDGFLQVDSRLATAEPGLHALGAAVAVPLSPPVVERQAGIVAACAAGLEPTPLRYGRVPLVARGPCPLLTAGLSTAAARARGFRVACGRSGDREAWVRCVRDAETGALLGVQAAGPGAAALAGPVLALLAGGTSAIDAGAGPRPDLTADLPAALAAALRAAAAEVRDGG